MYKKLIANKHLIPKFDQDNYYRIRFLLRIPMAQSTYIQKRYSHKRQASSIDSNIDHKKPREDSYSPAPENSNIGYYRTDEQILDRNKHSQQIFDKLDDQDKDNPTYQELKEANRNLNADERLALNSLLESRGYPETAQQ
jgi:hypothetical protein